MVSLAHSSILIIAALWLGGCVAFDNERYERDVYRYSIRGDTTVPVTGASVDWLQVMNEGERLVVIAAPDDSGSRVVRKGRFVSCSLQVLTEEERTSRRDFIKTREPSLSPQSIHCLGSESEVGQEFLVGGVLLISDSMVSYALPLWQQDLVMAVDAQHEYRDIDLEAWLLTLPILAAVSSVLIVASGAGSDPEGLFGLLFLSMSLYVIGLWLVIGLFSVILAGL